MQKMKTRLYPDCSYCGERLEKKNELLPGLVQCPKCKNEHYVDTSYDQKVMSLLSAADIKKNLKQFTGAFNDYEAIIQDHPEMIEAHWGMFLCSFGVNYSEENGKSRYMPVMHRYSDDTPTQNEHYLKVLELSRDKYKKKHFIAEGELIDQVWRNSKPALKKAEKVKTKKVEVVEEAQGEVTSESSIIRKRGTNIPEGYKIDAILENKIKNAEVLYLKTGKFGRAIKIFEEVLEIDPYAKRALWGKLLCKLQVSDFDLLGFNIKLNIIFPLFEEVMECLSKADENIYLTALENYFFKKLNSVNIFDDELYDYIMSWKKKGEQKTFINKLFNEIKRLLENETMTEVSWLHPALAAATSFDKIEDKALYVSKYIEIAQDLNLLELYKDALRLAEVVVLEDEKNQDALLIQLCTTYKVPQLSDLHLALKDLKQIKVLEDLIASGYKKLDIFNELKLAADDLIEQGNFKQAIPIFDLFVLHLPKKAENTLIEALLDFSGNLIYKEKFKEAEKYVNLLIEKDPLLPAAHWNKLKIALSANTNFDVLMYSKKDLMEYSDFAHTINSTNNPEDYIKFYELHDQLKQPVPESRKFKKMASKHYDELEKKCSNLDIHTFVTTIIPEMKKEIEVLVRDEQARVTNLFMRSIVIVIMLAFAFMLSNIRTFFGGSGTYDGPATAWFFWLFLKDLGGYIVIGTFIVVFILESLIEGKGIFKGVLRGILLGLVFAALGLTAGAAIPWALTTYLGTFLFGLSSYIVSGVLFGLVAIGAFFVLRGSHLKLMEETNNKKSITASWINIAILIIIILAALAFSIKDLIL